MPNQSRLARIVNCARSGPRCCRRSGLSKFKNRSPPPRSAFAKLWQRLSSQSSPTCRHRRILNDRQRTFSNVFGVVDPQQGVLSLWRASARIDCGFSNDIYWRVSMLAKLVITAVVSIGVLFPVTTPQPQHAANVACCQAGNCTDCPCPDCPLCPDCCCCDDCPLRSACCSSTSGCHAGEGCSTLLHGFALMA